jgi:broad specificity phosphatase PhoE
MKKREKLKIYLFRHGETTYNRDKIFTGFKDAKLSSLGKKQANIIAIELKNKKFQAAFYTRLSRSKDTLKPVLKFHPECVMLIKDDRIIERGYGSLEGKTHKSIIEKFGKKQFDKWHRGFNTKPGLPGKRKGESYADVEKRVKKFIKDLKKFMKKNKVNVAISAHGNSIRLFRKIWEKASVKETTSWFIPYDRVFTYNV